jgi:hypothetical protein
LIQTVVKALMQAACRCFDIELVTQPLSDAEWQQILAQPPLDI